MAEVAISLLLPKKKPDPTLASQVEVTTMKRKPYKYQLEGVAKIEKFKGRALLADSPGLGKTLQAIMYMLNHKELRPVVVVCPASIKYNWQRELSMEGMQSVVLDGQKPLRSTARQAPVVILNYDILSHWLETLKSLQPKLIVFDECHYAASVHARRTKASRTLADGVLHVIGLSGTPLTSRPAQLWPMLNILRPDLYPSLFTFGENYCEPQKVYGQWTFNGSVRQRLLNHRLKKTVLIRRRKEDVFKELPPKVRVVVPLDLGPSGYKKYKEANENFRAWLYNYDPIKASGEQRNEGFQRITYLQSLTAKLKLPAILDWVDNFLESTDEKIMLGAIHREIMVDKLVRKYQPNCAVVYGGTPNKKRDSEFQRFNNDPDCRVFIGNLEAAGTGWNCRATDKQAHCEADWRPGIHTQFEDRCHGLFRGKGGDTAFYYYLVAHGTIDEVVVKVLERKQNNSDMILDGRSGVSQFNIFTDLMLEMKKELL